MIKIKGPRFSDEQRNEMIELYLEGIKCDYIASKYGCNPSYPGQLAANKLGVLRAQGIRREAQKSGLTS